MIRYEIPGLTEFTDIIMSFIYLTAAHPQIQLDGVGIDAVYGGFPGSRLCGGRNNIGNQMPQMQVEQLVSEINSHGISCNVTFTNQHFTADMLSSSRYENMILEVLARNDRNGVIFYSDEIADAVRSRFPSLKLIASTTRSCKSVEKMKNDLSQYDRVVLDYDCARDDSFIAQLEPASRIEMMVNEYCQPKCPFRAEHYSDVSKAQFEGRRSSFVCRHEPAPQAYGFMQGMCDGEVFLKNADVRRYNEDFGIENFKIVGRGLDRWDIVDSLTYYLANYEEWYSIRDFFARRNMG